MRELADVPTSEDGRLIIAMPDRRRRPVAYEPTRNEAYENWRDCLLRPRVRVNKNASPLFGRHPSETRMDTGSEVAA